MLISRVIFNIFLRDSRNHHKSVRKTFFAKESVWTKIISLYALFSNNKLIFLFFLWHLFRQFTLHQLWLFFFTYHLLNTFYTYFHNSSFLSCVILVTDDILSAVSISVIMLLHVARYFPLLFLVGNSVRNYVNT